MITTNEQTIARLEKSGRILAKALQKTAAAVAPGMSTKDLDVIAQESIEQQGGTPAFLNYSGFPASLCTSRNHIVVHGIPSKDEKLQEGDIIGLDLGVNFEGAFTDMAVTVSVGPIPEEVQRLITTTRKSLTAGLDVLHAGVRTGDIGAAVQAVAEASGYGVVRDFVGHGVGAAVHEEPQIPNVGRAGFGAVLPLGSVIAIEPMINMGGPGVTVQDDRWAVATNDRGLSAHFEVTVRITEKGFSYITPPFL
ncbi:MAG: type I methionyl aminopeptidase [Patescibacteria group bacterium]|jgi:methionyl aminopeptidase